MNRTGVIVGMTIAVFIVLAFPLTAIFGGIPPWPVIFWFVASHVFFCAVISRVKPFTGPYRKPLTDPTAQEWR
jgi:predicted MFS family arabinose efflux permease